MKRRRTAPGFLGLAPFLLAAALCALPSPAAAKDAPPRGARAVVAAISRVAAENASRPAAERVDGDALADAYLRAGAFAARRDRSAFFLGALHAVDGTGALAKLPPFKALLADLETPEAAAARRKAIGRPTLRGRLDFLLHALAAGAVATIAGEPAARAVAYGKEEADMRGGTGFSFADLFADEAGIALAVALAEPAGSATWERLEAAFQGADFLPDPAAEPEGLSSEAFAKEFGGKDDSRFVAKRDALRYFADFSAFLKPPPPRDVSRLLLMPVIKHEIPAMAGAITWRGKTTALGVTGERVAGSEKDEEQATLRDLWHLGSCTKSMTATLAAIHVERGDIAWDTTVSKVLAGFMKVDRGWKDVTIDLLLHNRGGAPAGLDEGGLWRRLWGFDGSPLEARLALAEGVLSRPPPMSPGTKHVYSNAGFAIAGAMLEAPGTPWETLIARDLWAPLGITTGGFGAPGTRGTIDQPRGHTADGKPVEPGPGSDNPAAIGPAGTARMSIGDWAKYVALHVEGEGIAPRLLSPATFRRLHAPLAGDEASYAMGWLVTERPWGGRVLTHSGSNTMWYCVTWLSPSKEFAVLVTCNRGGDEAAKGCDEAAWALIEDHFAHEGAPK